jgi:hypothetical protein
VCVKTAVLAPVRNVVGKNDVLNVGGRRGVGSRNETSHNVAVGDRAPYLPSIDHPMALLNPECSRQAVLRGIHDTGVECRAVEFRNAMAGTGDRTPFALPEIPAIIRARSRLNHITAIEVMVWSQPCLRSSCSAIQITPGGAEVVGGSHRRQSEETDRDKRYPNRYVFHHGYPLFRRLCRTGWALVV